MKPVLMAALLLSASPAFAQTSPGNPQIDYSGFETLTGQVRDYRRARLIGLDRFKREAARPGTVLLDARSAEAFARGHIEGAVNLPFTDFTAETLARVIGKKDRKILIYCNNNFKNDVPPVALKSVSLALNIQTFINLVGYGYRNVSELNEVIDFRDPRVPWVRG